MDRKIVKPAQDGGKIWSPEHGRFLPAEGIEMQMTPHWLHLLERKDIAVSDVPQPKSDDLAPPAAVAKSASPVAATLAKAAPAA